MAALDNLPTYDQPSKQRARELALEHAVELLTRRREHCAIVPDDYLDKVWAKVTRNDHDSHYAYAAHKCRSEDRASWRAFRTSVVGQRSPSDLTVAYLAGPEPTNDIEVLMRLGIRPENIWAFESSKNVFEQALSDVVKSRLRGVKLMDVSIEEYFQSTPRRFDIIYLDACGPLPSHDAGTTQALVNVFRHSALTPLGVLISNFSAPDVSKEEVLTNYSTLVASYLYPKAFLDTFDDPEHTYTDGAQAHGFSLGEEPADQFDNAETRSDEEAGYGPSIDFISVVKDRFLDYYGSFITRHIADIASIAAPMSRLSISPLLKYLITDFNEGVARGRRFVEFNEDAFLIPGDDEDEILQDEQARGGLLDSGVAGSSESASIDEQGKSVDSDGDAITDSSFYSILYSLAACGLIGKDFNFVAPTKETQKFCRRWANQLSGSPALKHTAVDSIACFYALRHDSTLWASALKELASFDYAKQMPFLCDVPTEELSFYPAFAQIAYPAHNNIREKRRFRYVAEGKTTMMFLDVLPFDECRYVYDWLSTAWLMSGDWRDQSRQMIFRFALDGIVKNIRWYQDDFLFGCHVVGIDDGYFDPPMYALREVIKVDTPDVD